MSCTHLQTDGPLGLKGLEVHLQVIFNEPSMQSISNNPNATLRAMKWLPPQLKVYIAHPGTVPGFTTIRWLCGGY